MNEKVFKTWLKRRFIHSSESDRFKGTETFRSIPIYVTKDSGLTTLIESLGYKEAFLGMRQYMRDNKYQKISTYSVDVEDFLRLKKAIPSYNQSLSFYYTKYTGEQREDFILAIDVEQNTPDFWEKSNVLIKFGPLNLYLLLDNDERWKLGSNYTSFYSNGRIEFLANLEVLEGMVHSKKIEILVEENDRKLVLQKFSSSDIFNLKGFYNYLIDNAFIKEDLEAAFQKKEIEKEEKRKNKLDRQRKAEEERRAEVKRKAEAERKADAEKKAEAERIRKKIKNRDRTIGGVFLIVMLILIIYFFVILPAAR